MNPGSYFQVFVGVDNRVGLLTPMAAVASFSDVVWTVSVRSGGRGSVRNRTNSISLVRTPAFFIRWDRSSMDVPRSLPAAAPRVSCSAYSLVQYLAALSYLRSLTAFLNRSTHSWGVLAFG